MGFVIIFFLEDLFVYSQRFRCYNGYDQNIVGYCNKEDFHTWRYPKIVYVVDNPWKSQSKMDDLEEPLISGFLFIDDKSPFVGNRGLPTSCGLKPWGNGTWTELGNVRAVPSAQTLQFTQKPSAQGESCTTSQSATAIFSGIFAILSTASQKKNVPCRQVFHLQRLDSICQCDKSNHKPFTINGCALDIWFPNASEIWIGFPEDICLTANDF